MNKGIYKPENYITHLFKSYDIILLGEDHGVKDHLKFVANLITPLYNCGVRNIVMEFGASEDQEALDLLLTSDTYDESKARELIYGYNVIFPYKEYWDLYEAVWTFNQDLDDDQEPFRIVNMSYIYDWSRAVGPESVSHPDIIRKIFHKGTVEAYRANIIEKEILNKGQKALILTGTIHAYSHFDMPTFDYLEENFVRYINKHLGNLLYHRYPDQVITVLFHQPFYIDTYREIVGETLNQLMETAYENNDSQPIGIDFTESEIGNLTDQSYLALGNNHLQLKDIAKGYIILKPLNKLTGCSVDNSFTKGHTLAEITNQWPDPNWHKPVETMDQYWDLVSNYVDLKQRYKIHYK